MIDSATPWTVPLQAPLSSGFTQARIPEWIAISFSRGSSQLQGSNLGQYRQMLYRLNHQGSYSKGLEVCIQAPAHPGHSWFFQAGWSLFPPTWLMLRGKRVTLNTLTHSIQHWLLMFPAICVALGFRPGCLGWVPGHQRATGFTTYLLNLLICSFITNLAAEQVFLKPHARC